MIVVLMLSCFAVRSWIEKRAAERRQVEYQTAVKRYSDVLKVGMTRREVEYYLAQRHEKFGRMCCVHIKRHAFADLVKIGEESPPWYCNHHFIDVAFEFEATSPHELVEAYDSDRLISVTLFPHLEQCM